MRHYLVHIISLLGEWQDLSQFPQLILQRPFLDRLPHLHNMVAADYGNRDVCWLADTIEEVKEDAR